MNRDFSFCEWEKEKDVNHVCSSLLDNANMEIRVSSYPFGVELLFFVIGSDIKIIFTCKEIGLFSIEKMPDEDSMFTVLEVSVERIKNYWKISILPEANVKIECVAY